MAALRAVAAALCFPLGAAALDEAAHPPPGMLVGVVSHQLHIHCVGEGEPTVVFDSGLGGNSLDWSKVQPEVARFTRACVYDRSGYGWSEAGPFPRSSARSADELSRLLVYASVPEPYVLVGHSIGGFNVRLFAQANRAKVAGLVLVDAASEHQFQRFDDAGIRVPIAPTGASFVIANHWAVPHGLPDTLRDTAQALVLRPNAIRTLYSELQTIRRSATQVREMPAAPDVPTVVIARDDPPPGANAKTLKMASLWREMQQELAHAAPRSRLVTAAGSGHHVQLDRPAYVIDAVRELVDESRQHAVN